MGLSAFYEKERKERSGGYPPGHDGFPLFITLDRLLLFIIFNLIFSTRLDYHQISHSHHWKKRRRRLTWLRRFSTHFNRFTSLACDSFYFLHLFLFYFFSSFAKKRALFSIDPRTSWGLEIFDQSCCPMPPSR